MKRERLGLLLGVGLALLGCAGAIFTLPLATIVEGPALLSVSASQIRFEPGTLVRQTLALPTPTPREIAPRIWVQLLPAANHFLQARVEGGGQILGEAVLTLPAGDNAFHMVQLPWQKLPSGTSGVTLVFEGHGVAILATNADRIAGGSVEVDGVAQISRDLALQMVSGDRGIERYLPLSRIAAGKPGLLGSPRFFLMVMYLYLIVVVVLVGSVFRLLRYIERVR